MKSLWNENINPSLLLDCSQNEEVHLLAKKLKVSPQVIKAAVRACCNNEVSVIEAYLRQSYLPAKKRLSN